MIWTCDNRAWSFEKSAVLLCECAERWTGEAGAWFDGSLCTLHMRCLHIYILDSFAMSGKAFGSIVVVVIVIVELECLSNENRGLEGALESSLDRSMFDMPCLF